MIIDVNPRVVEPANAFFSGVDLVGAMLDCAAGGTAQVRPRGCVGVLSHQALLAILCAARTDGLAPGGAARSHRRVLVARRVSEIAGGSHCQSPAIRSRPFPSSLRASRRSWRRCWGGSFTPDRSAPVDGVAAGVEGDRHLGRRVSEPAGFPQDGGVGGRTPRAGDRTPYNANRRRTELATKEGPETLSAPPVIPAKAGIQSPGARPHARSPDRTLFDFSLPFRSVPLRVKIV